MGLEIEVSEVRIDGRGVPKADFERLSDLGRTAPHPPSAAKTENSPGLVRDTGLVRDMPRQTLDLATQVASCPPIGQALRAHES